MNKDETFKEIEIYQVPKKINKKWKLVTLYKFDIDGNRKLWQVVFNGVVRESEHNEEQDDVLSFNNVQVHHSSEHDTYRMVLTINHGIRGDIQSEEVVIRDEGHLLYMGHQALRKAKQLYIEQIHKGYVPAGTREVPLMKGMKGIKFDEKLIKGDVQYSVEPKPDGIRIFIRRLPTMKIEIRTYENVVKKHLTHIAKDIEGLFDYLPPYAGLDGEVYIHGVPLYIISSMFRSDVNIHPQLQSLQYHIHDVAIENMEYEDRKQMLVGAYESYLEAGGHANHWCIMPSYIASDLKQIYKLHRTFVDDMGYDSSVVKFLTGPKSMYRFEKRSNGVLKLKDDEDDEFEILDVISANGKDKGTAIFELRVPNTDLSFTARPEGPFELRKSYLDSRRQLKGLMARVVYKNINKQTGIPREARVKSVRDYE